MTIKTKTSDAAVEVSPKKPRSRKPKAESQADVVEATPVQPALPQDGTPVTGRGVFAVRLLGQAVSVEAVFLAQDGNVLRLPAVFPDRGYALEQIDQLRELVNRHFDALAEQAQS